MYLNLLNDRLKERYGCKVYKLSLSSGCGCPNRDAEGRHGCIFCDGAGAFTASGTIDEQLKTAKARVSKKIKGEAKYIAYFQSFTNTYAPVETLEPLFLEAMAPDDVVALSIATRPDCLSPDILDLLSCLNAQKPVWVELGLQTIHEATAHYIRRGYALSVYDEAVRALKARGITVIVHAILGLPKETPEMMAQTTEYIGKSGADGIKFHLLHVLEHTDLAEEWRAGNVPELTLSEYTEFLKLCIAHLPKHVVIHRLTGDGPKQTLLSPLWSADKKRVLNTCHQAFRAADLQQGSLYPTY